MHVSGRSWKNRILLLAILLGRTVSAGPGFRRAAVTASALNPWVSVDPNGKIVSTVTPVLTTINGVATTLNAPPASLTDTASPTDGLAATTTAGDAGPTQTGGPGAFEVCHNLDGDLRPFCKPDNGSAVYIDETYYVTWDTNFFRGNETIVIMANYVNATGGGHQAWQSDRTPNTWGFVSMKVQSEWLKSLSSNNISLFITAAGGRSEPGPTLMVTTRPTVYNHQPPTKAPTGLSLYIGLPAVAAFVILCVCGTFIWNRKHRKIDLGNVMGRRRGYGVGKSRRQRLGLGREGKKGAIQLRTQELTAGGQYRDAPSEHGEFVGHEVVEHEAEYRAPQHRRGDSDGLASLVGTPTEERPPARGANVFRDEMRRQEKNNNRF